MRRRLPLLTYTRAPAHQFRMKQTVFWTRPVEECVRPDGNAAKWRGDGGVVDEELVVHHLELRVAADPQIRRAHPDHRAVSYVGEPLDYQPETRRSVFRP